MINFVNEGLSELFYLLHIDIALLKMGLMASMLRNLLSRE
jgi:hypothetical protein